MKTYKPIQKWVILCISLTLLAFSMIRDSKSEYNVPRAAYSITTTDLNLDGNLDIITGHKTAWEHNNPTVSILKNNSLGTFDIYDTSIVFTGYQENIIAAKIDQDNYPDLICFYTDFSTGIIDRYIRIIYNENGNYHFIKDFSLNSSETFTSINIGDINGDSFIDLVVTSNIGKFWGILYNDGLGNFSTPEYYNLNFHPLKIACGDLNKDGKDDIVIAGRVEIFFSTDNGFQSVLIDAVSDEVEIADFDKDGDLDIISSIGVIGNTNFVHFIENLGNMEFHDYGTMQIQPYSSNLTVTDFNNDSLPDLLFSTTQQETLMILYNNGDFTLSEPQFIPMANYGEVTRQSACADFDGNGYQDIATVRYIHSILPANVNILFNNGKGNFVENPISDTPEITNTKKTLSVQPNPFSQSSIVKFSLNKKHKVDLSVYDINGKKIKTIENKVLPKGEYQYKWNALDKNGKEVKAGIYFICLIAGMQYQTQKLIYIQ